MCGMKVILLSKIHTFSSIRPLRRVRPCNMSIRPLLCVRPCHHDKNDRGIPPLACPCLIMLRTLPRTLLPICSRWKLRMNPQLGLTSNAT
ncbi:hypothetical protein BDB00DRAFT_814426 [Zychaea mexicana]|uniref:uncharacterized protein n=1 Tax=Zychaea mexicana TaxID=64656 RepID=UPI0022FE6F79|nr:uncharacterized protein BDB00DRAFT_860567 [Zychaea mexicana]XP_052981642.1 uncharacterized protein BDB00DRAFT_814426 [Zychaea mexicana]KAI9474319.1 hypothetical protein BDB00DRAFT_860567 [Zychaea mexicana]KAI9495377.1 hypothetical protein BDB00DRAFT_814426 [Zychaea mexicana]